MSSYKSCPCPKSSPWGSIQDKKELAPGIWQVSTAGHGGIKLSRERNAAVPEYMRVEGGWYEEDCEWSIAAVVHPIAFQRVVKIEGRPDKTEFDYAMDALKNWYPGYFEMFTGRLLQPGESRTRDEQVWKATVENDFVVSAAWGDWAHWVPKGKVGVVARRASDNVEKWFLVDCGLYEKRTGFGFVVDLTRDTEITKPERPC
jgi:hypothetical protein